MSVGRIRLVADNRGKKEAKRSVAGVDRCALVRHAEAAPSEE